MAYLPMLLLFVCSYIILVCPVSCTGSFFEQQAFKIHSESYN